MGRPSLNNFSRGCPSFGPFGVILRGDRGPECVATCRNELTLEGKSLPGQQEPKMSKYRNTQKMKKHD